MAQVIRPEIWQEGIDDNRLLPSRYTTNIFTGKGVNIANNEDACRVYDLQVTDYITDYDDRRINGLLGSPQSGNGNDGWSASSYGIFQDVRFDSRVYTMGRHRSVAMRIFDEMQYSGKIGEWGTATESHVITSGQALMKTAQQISKAKDIWQKQVLGPDIDKYNLFAILNGHISGRFVQTNPDVVFNGEGEWVAQPGMVQGEAIPPRFAPIHCIQWDEENIPLLLQNIKVTWNNLFIPEDDRVILIDPYYEYHLLAALTGKGIPATDSAYSDLQNGSFTRLMGWDFNFEIPSQYWPKLWVDDNLNVVHSEDGDAPCDAILRSIAHTEENDPGKRLLLELVDSDRMNRPNFVRTIFDGTTKTFQKVISNYPLGMPGAVDYLGERLENYRGDVENTPYGGTWTYKQDGSRNTYTFDQSYPWTRPGAGYGLAEEVSDDAGNTVDGWTGPVLENDTGKATRVRVIGCAVYKPAAQLSQEYSEMRTADGETRGKFTEMVMDVKYDAWVIERLSHGILPIIEGNTTGTFGIPVKIIESQPVEVTTGSTPLTVKGSGTNGKLTVDGTAVVSPAQGSVWSTQEVTTEP